MKELILFSAALLFISCQNFQTASLPTPTQEPTARYKLSVQEEASSCTTQDSQETTLDIVQELQNPQNPGFYYRQVVLRSEPEVDNLFCVSNVSSDAETPQVAPLADNSPAEESESPAEDWSFLTAKWTYVPASLTCQDSNQDKINPACDNGLMLIQESTLASLINAPLITSK